MEWTEWNGMDKWKAQPPHKGTQAIRIVKAALAALERSSALTRALGPRHRGEGPAFRSTR